MLSLLVRLFLPVRIVPVTYVYPMSTYPVDYIRFSTSLVSKLVGGRVAGNVQYLRQISEVRPTTFRPDGGLQGYRPK